MEDRRKKRVIRSSHLEKRQSTGIIREETVDWNYTSLFAYRNERIRFGVTPCVNQVEEIHSAKEPDINESLL